MMPPLPRCMLFVPALAPERFAKALASGADTICIDLEDAIAPSRKAEARETLIAYLSNLDRPDPRIWLRINAAETKEGQDDLAALEELDRPLSLLLPKVEAAGGLHAVGARLGGGTRLIAIVETALGLSQVETLAHTGEPLAGLLFGPGDLSASLGCAPAWDALLYARSRTVLAARTAGIGVIDGPYFDLADAAGAGSEAAAAAALGFDGKVAVHPLQVAPIMAGFMPSGDEISRARRILDIFADERVGVAMIDGRLVDGPLIENARRVIRQAGEAT
ncbi:CoA ester lyase [Hyphomicrobiales bacterium]|nr:CoA ester lyase [Hyphomicrobiales bacterium]CAH1697550.1 CoA ester lyase [Hyphomicrobiales bacterium]CAI0346305.1 citrate lyase subunit beta / citryl-CoA lyase [Hyphomicrobiales bacterium]